MFHSVLWNTSVGLLIMAYFNIMYNTSIFPKRVINSTKTIMPPFEYIMETLFRPFRLGE